MIQKILSNIYLGVKGILINGYFTPKQKALLMLDYSRFASLLVGVVIFKIKIHKVYISSFRYTVYLHNYQAFFYIFNEIFCKSIYSPQNIHTYADLGANIGLTILWYKIFNPDLVVTAFEPDKYTYKILLKNISVNHLTNVTVHNIALCDKKGTMPFFTVIDNVQSLDSGLSLNQNLPHEKYSVKTDIFSHFVNKPIDLVKIDIEGAEYQVFDDLFKTRIIKKINQIIFETHYFKPAQKKLVQPLIRKLAKFGTVRSLENSMATTVFHFTSGNF